MARIRSVHPGLFIDDAFMELSLGARLLLIGIWVQCDDHGVFEWRPKSLKAAIFPGDDITMPELMLELVLNSCIIKVQIDGKDYGAVRNFCKYQRPKKPTYRYPFTEQFRTYVAFDGEAVTHQSGKSSAEGVGIGGGVGKGKGEAKTNSDSVERESAAIVEAPPPAASGSPSEVSNPVLKEVKSPGPALRSVIGTELPHDWLPADELCEDVKRDFGMAIDDIRSELITFHAHHATAGSFSSNWNASFVTWCKRWKDHRDKQVAPRVQLSNAKAFVPTDDDWEKAIQAFKADESRWPKWAGNNPASGKVPRHLLAKHGWDADLRRFIAPGKAA